MTVETYTKTTNLSIIKSPILEKNKVTHVNHPENKKHILLIGFMGSGKSTVGKLLAKRLNVTFIDMDNYIEEKEGEKIKKIFADQGEEYFRRLEHDSLIELLDKKELAVISTGGGTPCFFDNMGLILNNGLSFYIKVGRMTLAHRLQKDTERPLIQSTSWKELATFIDSKLREREIFYNQANYKIRGANVPEKLVTRIVRLLNQG